MTNFSKYYHNLKIIGRGTFAKVVDSERIIDGHKFAVKTFDKNNIENSKLSTRTKVNKKIFIKNNIFSYRLV